jgi:hypothetical protein
MRSLFLLAAAPILTACAQPQVPSSPPTSDMAALVKLGGEGEFIEVKRDAGYSIVEVTKSPAGSVVSSMYALRGACAVLRARNAEYVASERISSLPSYRLTFPKTPRPEELSGAKKSVFSSSDCSALRF